MKSKFLLLSLLAAAGLIAADAPAGAPAGTPPPAKGEKGVKPEKNADKAESKKNSMPDVPGVSPEDMKKYQDARKAAMGTAEVKAAKEASEAASKKAKEVPAEEKKAAMEEANNARKSYYDSIITAIVKADPTLAEVAKKVDDHMKTKSKKPKGAKKTEGEVSAAPPATPETK
jgi:hypothetical protein